MIQAACELIPEVGVAGLTHRLVAERAGVPLGATTYYFASLDDLVAETLAYAAEVTTECLRDWAAVLASSTDVAATLASLAGDYLRDRAAMVTWNELYTAAAHTPELRPLARLWSDGLIEVLSAHARPDAARAAAAFLDGVFLHALIGDEALDQAALTRSLATLLAMDTVRERLQADLKQALKSRDTVAASTIRSLLGAIANAEAVAAPEKDLGAAPLGVVGVGAAEAARRELTEAEILDIIRADAAERGEALSHAEQHAPPETVERLRAESGVLARYLS